MEVGRPINQRAWLLGSSAVLVGYVLLGWLFGPIPYHEIHIGVGHLPHVLLVVVIVTLFPGLPFSRLYYCDREGSLARVVGLAFILNTCFFVGLSRVLSALGIEPSALVIFGPVVVLTGAGLLLLLRRARRGPALSWVRGEDRFNLFVACCLVLSFVIVQAPNVSRPSYLYIERSSWHTPALSRTVATHKFGEEFRELSNGRFRLPGGISGPIVITCRRCSHKTTYPLRLVVTGPVDATLVLTEGSQVLLRKRIDTFLDRQETPFMPLIQSTVLAVDLPLPVSKMVHLRVEHGDDVLWVEDQTRGVPARSRFRPFEGRMLTEALHHMHNAVQGNYLYDLEPDMPVGYLMHSMPQLLAGRGLLVLNLFSIAVGMICFLLVCDFVQPQLRSRRRLAVILPFIATFNILSKLLEDQRLFLPDLSFTVYLLVAMGLASTSRLPAYWVASFPTALTRLSGVPLLGLHHAVLVLLGPERKRLLRELGLSVLFWVLMLSVVLVHLTGREGWLKNLFVSIYCIAFVIRRTIDPLPLGARLLGFGNSLLRATGGLSVFLLAPLHGLGRRFGLVVLFYSAFLTNHQGIGIYHFVPLAFFCAIAAAVNILQNDRAWRFLLPVAVALGTWQILLPPLEYRGGTTSFEQWLQTHNESHTCR